MGPLFVLGFWFTIAGILSVLGGFVMVGLVAFLLRGVRSGKKRALAIAGLLPAAGFAYLFACTFAFSIWSAARGRDWGWGDTWDTPILGSYHLMMIDVTDNATIYNSADPKVYSDGSVTSSPGDKDVVFGVRRLEVRPPYLIGTAAPDASVEYPVKSPETLFFILDTRNGKQTDEPSLAALQAKAQGMGGPLRLKSVYAVYSDFRYGWIDLIPLTFFAIPPMFTLFWLLRALMRLRATRSAAPSTQP